MRHEMTRNELQGRLSEAYEKAYRAWLKVDELIIDIGEEAEESAENAELASALEDIARVMDNSQDDLFQLMKQYKKARHD